MFHDSSILDGFGNIIAAPRNLVRGDGASTFAPMPGNPLRTEILEKWLFEEEENAGSDGGDVVQLAMNLAEGEPR